jgi:hypothetical protein
MIKHFCAANDVNGNPQRCYVLVDEDGRNLAAWDEGYLGHHAVPEYWRKAANDAERMNCSMRWYRKMLRTLPSPTYACDLPGYSHLRSAV